MTDPTDLDVGDALDISASTSPTRLQTMIDAATTIRAVDSVEDVAAALVDRGVVAVHGTRGVVVLIDDAGTRLKLLASSGYDPAYLAGWQEFSIDSDVPLAEAVRAGRIVVVTSVEEFARRYPTVTLPDLRPHALVAVPLRVGARVVGGWGIRLETSVDHVVAAAAGSRYLGDVASAGIARASTVAALEARVAQLQHALTSRIAVEQAKGVLSERHSLTVDEAFARLRQFARNTGRRVHDVAMEVVAGTLDPVHPDRDATNGTAPD